jgi:hypothetical protein
MNMKSLTVVFGALTLFALGACNVKELTTTSTVGGAGGGTTTAGVGGAGGSGGSGATGTGGAAGCDDMYTCGEAITPPDGDASKLCDGPHGDLYDALNACTCAGACKTQCEANACAGMSASAECTACLQDSVAGCSKEFEACSGDI